MANVRADLVFMLKEKNIQRGYNCGQTPGGEYFEKKGGKWNPLGVKTVGDVFKKKGWKMPAAEKKVAKKATKKKAAGKKPAKKVVKKNVKKAKATETQAAE